MGLLYSNYECNPTNNLNINAVNGTLVKTFKGSYFKTFDIDSKAANTYFNEKPFRGDWDYNRGDFINKIDIVVLQSMLCGDDKILVEAIDKDIFDKHFESKDKEQ